MKTKKQLEDDNDFSDTITDFFDKIEAKQLERQDKEDEKNKYKKELRKEAAGKLAGWGDYKFDWEK